MTQRKRTRTRRVSRPKAPKRPGFAASEAAMRRDLEELKTQFVSNVTHELRTPLVVIQHTIDVILGQAAGALSEPQQKLLTIAQRNVGRLNKLVDDVLDLSRIETHRIEMNMEPASLEQVITQACESLNTWARDHALCVEQHVAALPAVCMDAGRIEQVINNLVSNAVKFTPRGGAITVTAQPSQARMIEVSVADTGVGIPADDVPKLFQKFQQARNQSPHEARGTGLGLAMAREIVELHHGKIWLESHEGQGTRVAFTLPVTGPKRQMRKHKS